MQGIPFNMMWKNYVSSKAWKIALAALPRIREEKRLPCGCEYGYEAGSGNYITFCDLHNAEVAQEMLKKGVRL